MTGKSKAIVSLVGVFILGFILGLVVFKAPEYKQARRSRLTPDQFTATLVDRFTRELSLNPSQIEALKTQLQYVRTQHDSLRQSGTAAMAHIRDHFRTEFSKVLTPEQQQKFIEFNRKEDDKFHRHKPEDD
ncbi:MAG TPA: hypothetical protein PKI62_15785 [bacterium]|nr:hypothetical protein [bacterium]HPR88618.1 hypothetical protein [bacterium]